MARLQIVALCGVLLFARSIEAQFTDVTCASGLGTAGRKDGGLGWGDFNNDGCLDVLVNTNQGGVDSFLYIHDNPAASCAGTFTDVTACLAPALQSTRLERSAIWGDINNDGFVDFARNGSSAIEIYLNNGTGSTTCGATTVN